MWGPPRSGQPFTSSVPGYPSNSLNPLAKRLSAGQLPQNQISLKRRTSITRTSPGKPVSVFARPRPLLENSRAPTPAPKAPPKLKENTTKAKSASSSSTKSNYPLGSRTGNQAAMSDNTSSASSAGQQYYARKMLEMRELLKTPEQKYLSSRPHSKTQASKKTELLEQQAGQSSSSGIDKKKNSGPLGPASVNEPNIRKKPQPKEEDKLPPLRFSPMKERYGNRLSTVGSSLNRTTIENKGKSVESKSPPRSPSHSPTKSQRSDMYAWRNSVPRKKVRVTSRSIKPPVYRSRIPVASRPESILQEDIEDTPTPVARMESMAQEGTVSDQGSKDQEICSDNPSPSSDQFSADGPSPRAPKTYNSHVLSPAVEPIIFGERETISDLRKQFLQALGIEEVSLPSLSAYLMNVNFNSVLKDRLREIKIQEMFQRISVVKLLHTSSRYHGANENELGCVKGWLDDLMEELWMIECEKKQPTKVWFDQIYRWLWSRHHEEGSDPSQYDVSPSDELYVLFNAAPLRVLAAKKEHELFNLRDTGVELMRNGFRNKEKKMIEYWARLHGVQCPPSACGEEVIGIYMRKLTRWDKVELKDSSLQRRRMWYFCLEHYVHWKEAVSHYALALKMMNLLIVFHDLWGMHVDGMSNQEKKDFGVLHDNLYRFTLVFMRPVDGEGDSIWPENECMYCFSKAAAARICPEDRGKNIWMWLTQLAGIGGYGKYYSAILKVLTDGKDPEYVNQLFETHFWSPRTCSLMAGLKRIKDAMKKHAGPGDRMGLGVKKLGAPLGSFKF